MNAVWPFQCAQCGARGFKRVADVNRAAKINAPLFCDKACFGLSRRKGKTDAQRKAEKAAYDEAYRAKNADRIAAAKREYFQRTYDPVAAAVVRKARMPRHVEYCRRPEYRKWKAQYDRQYLARKQFGDFGEAAIVLHDLRSEIQSRSTFTERARDKGALNKWLSRRRDYERQTDRR